MECSKKSFYTITKKGKKGGRHNQIIFENNMSQQPTLIDVPGTNVVDTTTPVPGARTYFESKGVTVVAFVAGIAAIAFFIAFIIYIVRYNAVTDQYHEIIKPERNGFVQAKRPVAGAGVTNFIVYKTITLKDMPRACRAQCDIETEPCRAALWNSETGRCDLYSGEAVMQDVDDPTMWTYDKQ